jgi:hypothetical protein
MKKYNHPAGNKTERIIKASDDLLSRDKIRRARERMREAGTLDSVEAQFDAAAIADVDLKCINLPYDTLRQRRIDWILFQVSLRAERVKKVIRMRQRRKPRTNQSFDWVSISAR